MRYTSLATLVAALMVGSASMAYAQGSSQSQGSQQFGQGQGYGTQQFGQSGPGFNGNQQQLGQSSGNRLQERATLRRQLRQVGFQNIRILNAAYLVQARTPDGRGVIMVVDPPEMAGMGQMSQMGQRYGNQMMSQMGQQNQRSGMGQSQGMQGMSGNQQASSAQNQMGSGASGDSATGSLSNARLSESQVRSMLQERGLSNIQNLERSGNTYTASADWQGEQLDLSVNAITGEITQPDQL